MQKPGLKTISIAILVSLTIVIILIVKSCSGGNEKVFVYEKATRGEVKKTISVTGELGIMDPVVVVSKLNGVIEKVLTDFNQNVNKGQLLFRIDSTSIDQRILRMKGGLENSKYEIIATERDLEGKKSLYKDNLISKNAMEQATMQYNTVLNRYKQVKLDYDMTVQEKEYTRVYSPIDGIVIAIYVNQNTAVGVTTPLIQLAPSLKKMILTISIDESDIGIIKNGQEVSFSVSAFPDKKFNGVIHQVRINPVKSGGLVTYQALVVCYNDELLLKPGMTATATVVIDNRANVLRVLNQAFIISPDDDSDSESGKKYIWKKGGVTSGKPYVKTEVKQGLVGDMYTEIMEGLKDGEDVLIKIQESK